YRGDVRGAWTNVDELINETQRQYAWRYDSLLRLTNEFISDLGNLSYDYDVVGNRTRRLSDVAQLPPVHSSYSSNDWLTADVFDANGNTVLGAYSGGLALRCEYDWADRLTNASIDGRNIALTYNADGQRIRKVVTEPDSAGGIRTRS